MKKVISTLFSILVLTIASQATTYYWIGGLAGTSFTSGNNWTTDPVGRAPVGGSLTIGTTDVFIFDGTNLGGTTVVTGNASLIVSSLTATPFAQLKFINGVNMNFTRTTAGSSGMTINGDGTAAADLVVDATSTLTLGGGGYSFDVQITLGANATGLINGKVYFTPVGTAVHGRNFIASSAVNGLVFAAGSSAYSTDSTAASCFNASSSSIVNCVTFQSGSSLYYYTGRSPIGSNSTTQVTNFEPGSNLYIMKSNVSYIDGTTAYASSSWTSGKTFANVTISNGATYTADGTVNKIENFTIDAGSSFITHSSGQTPVLGNLVVNGTLSAPSGSSNMLVMGGNTPQSITGTGNITVPYFVVADNSDVTLALTGANKFITATTSSSTSQINIFGRINFTDNKITGTAPFTSRVNTTATAATGATLVAGSYLVTGIPAGTLSGVNGLTVTGTGIAPATNVVGFSASGGTLCLSKPIATSGTNITLNFSSDSAVLINSSINGFDSTTGAVTTTGLKNYQAGTNYVINAATNAPVGVSSGETDPYTTIGSITLNAPVTTNIGLNIAGTLTMNSGNLVIRSTDTVAITSGNAIAGAPFSLGKYIITASAAGKTGVLEIDNINGATLFPIGSVTSYLPVTINSTTDALAVSAYEGVTVDGTLTGTAMSLAQKAKIVDAAWVINRLPASTATGNITLNVNWPSLLEGSTFATYSNAEVGIAHYETAIISWGVVAGSGDNTANTATASVNVFGTFGVGQVGFALPVLFTDFRGVLNSSNVLLSWKIDGDINMDKYVIEKAEGNNGQYVELGSVTAKNAGTASLYSFTDLQGLNGTSFYRIKAVAKSGAVKYSTAISLSSLVKGKNEVLVYPNPIKGKTLRMQLNGMDAGEYTVTLVSPNGQVVFNKNIGTISNSQTLSLSLPQQINAGIYRLVIKSNQQQLQQAVVIE